MTVQEAYRWSIVNEVVPLPDLIPTGCRWASEILECTPVSRACQQAMRGDGVRDATW